MKTKFHHQNYSIFSISLFVLTCAWMGNALADDYGKTAHISVANMKVTGTSIKAENIPVIQVGMSQFFTESFAFKLEFAASANPDTGYTDQSATVNDPNFGRLYETMDLNVSLRSYLAAGIKTDVALGNSASVELAASLAYIDLEIRQDFTLHAPDYGNQTAGECDIVYYCPNYGSSSFGAVFNISFFVNTGQRSSLFLELKKYPNIGVDDRIKSLEPNKLNSSSIALGYQSYF